MVLSESFICQNPVFAVLLIYVILSVNFPGRLVLQIREKIYWLPG